MNDDAMALWFSIHLPTRRLNSVCPIANAIHDMHQYAFLETSYRNWETWLKGLVRWKSQEKEE